MDQKACDDRNGLDSNGRRIFATQQLQVNNKLGGWREARTVPNWPLGVTIIQYHYINYEWKLLAEVLRSFVRIGKATLRTRAGAIAYLLGEAFYHNTLALNLPEGQGPGYTKGEWIFPYVRFPYLTHVLNLRDIDLCGPDLEDRVDAAADEMF
jgi:hypothetical protein